MHGKIKIRTFLGIFKGCESTGDISLRPIFFLSPLANLRALVVRYCSLMVLILPIKMSYMISMFRVVWAISMCFFNFCVSFLY